MIEIAKPTYLNTDIADNRIRGYCFYTNILYPDQKTFKFPTKDGDEFEMSYPPYVILLTSFGELIRYAVLDKRPAYAQSYLLKTSHKADDLARPLGKPALPIAKPVQESKPITFDALNLIKPLGIYESEKYRLQEKVARVIKKFYKTNTQINEEIIKNLEGFKKEAAIKLSESSTIEYNCKKKFRAMKLEIMKSYDSQRKIQNAINYIGEEFKELKTICENPRDRVRNYTNAVKRSNFI
jgi:hypothetical protein